MTSCNNNILKLREEPDPIPDDFANDPEIKKYWSQRYRLFSKWNEGIMMDRESWFSVTPEQIAQHIAGTLLARFLCSEMILREMSL